MNRLAAYLKQTQEMREKVVGALVYPGFLLASGLAVGALFVGYLIPRLTGFLGKGAMPPSVAWMVDASTFLRTWWWALLLALVVGGVALWQYFRTPAGSKNWDAIRVRLPVVGPILRSGFQTEYLETLASLTGGGLPILTALDLARDVTTSDEHRQKLLEAQDRIRDGAPLYRSLERTGMFTPRMVELIRMGDHTGDLTAALKSASDRASAELNKRLQRMAALMQPVVTVFMALMVGIMAWLMITVIFDTISALRNS
jgi:type II secretory pathway component PulF